MYTRKIPKRKEKTDCKSWMYVNNAIKEFVKAQEDNKFQNI